MKTQTSKTITHDDVRVNFLQRHHQNLQQVLDSFEAEENLVHAGICIEPNETLKTNVPMYVLEIEECLYTTLQHDRQLLGG